MTKQAMIIAGAVVIVVAIAAFFLIWSLKDKTETTKTPTVTTNTTGTPTPATSTLPEVDKTKTVIGTSVEKRDIIAYHFGDGSDELLFVGGTHGGYAWNTTLVSYEMMDYLKDNPDAIPKNVTVTIIPVFNPDGLESTIGTTSMFKASDVPTSQEKLIAGRFNSNTVDLNRNFDCEWQEKGVWQSRSVSGGKAPFSEPESAALRDYVKAHKLTAAVVFYSAAGGVFSSNCRGGVSAETKTITSIFAKASGYPAHAEFDFYDITGDMVNWMAKEGIPAISVLLSNHKDVEADKNLAGLKALLAHYKK